MERTARRFTPTRIALIAGAAIAFGVFMGLRAEADSRWMRTLMAALAGAFLGVCIMLARKRRAT